MLHKLRLPTALLFLLLLFPAAQSARVRLFQHHHPHSPPRVAHHYKASSPPANELRSEFHHRPAAHPHIQMVTINEDAAAATHYQSIEALASMLDTPVSGNNHGENSASLANEKSQNLGEMLPLSGPNPGGNNQMLSAPSGPNPGGNKITPAKRSLIGAKSAQISVNSAQLVGGPLELNSLATMFGMLPRGTAVPPSAPSKGHNSATTGRNLFEEEEFYGEEGLIKMKVSLNDDGLMGKPINIECEQQRQDEEGPKSINHLHNPLKRNPVILI